MLRAPGILILCAALAGCATRQPVAAEVATAVEHASDRFFLARQQGDASSFSALFTEDGALMVPGVPDAVGRSAVSELARKMFPSGRISDFKIERRELRVIGDSAYELGWVSETNRHQDQSHRMQGRYFIMWKRGSDESWRVHRYFYNWSDAKPVA